MESTVGTLALSRLCEADVLVRRGRVSGSADRNHRLRKAKALVVHPFFCTSADDSSFEAVTMITSERYSGRNGVLPFSRNSMRSFLLLPLLAVPPLLSAVPVLPNSNSHAQMNSQYSDRTGGVAVNDFGLKCPRALPPGPHALDSVVATVRRRYRIAQSGYRIT